MGDRHALIDKAIKDGIELQVKLKGDLNPAPLGPAKIEKLEIPDGAGFEIFYKMYVQAAMQGRPNGPATRFILPITFSAEDVLWISEGPMSESGEKIVETIPGPGSRTSAGLVIPGR